MWMLQQIGVFLEVNQWWFMGRSYKARKLFRLNHYEGHVASSVIAWGTLLLHSNLFVLFFQGSLLHKRTDAPLPFCSSLSTWLSVQRSRKKGSSPCPVWLACRSHSLDGRSGKGVMLVKTRQTPVWNMESYFRSWRLLRPSAGQARKILLGLTSFGNFDHFEIWKRSWKLFICMQVLHMSTAQEDSHDTDFSQYPDFFYYHIHA